MIFLRFVIVCLECPMLGLLILRGELVTQNILHSPNDTLLAASPPISFIHHFKEYYQTYSAEIVQDLPQLHV
jgi:hypothetical protein